MKILVVFAALMLAGCSSSTEETKSLKAEPLRKYELKGEVQKLDAKNKVATIKHEAIGDWMGAMTMDFRVKEQADLDKLKEGAAVKGTVFVQGFDFWVGEVADPNSAPPPAK